MAQRHGDDEHPPAPRRPGRWDDFVPQMLANAAGTLLAAMVLYLYGEPSGLSGRTGGSWRRSSSLLSSASCSS
jgi:hypothetical protein